MLIASARLAAAKWHGDLMFFHGHLRRDFWLSVVVSGI